MCPVEYCIYIPLNTGAENVVKILYCKLLEI